MAYIPGDFQVEYHYEHSQASRGNMVQCRAIARPLTLTILEIMFALVSSMRTKLID